MNTLLVVRSEKGIAFPTAMFVVTIIALMGITIFFMTQSQVSNTEIMSDSTMSFNIAEAGLERLLSQYGANYPTNITNVNTVVSGYAAIALNGGQYNTSVMKDPNRAGNILITSVGTRGNTKRTIQVSVRGVPAAFNYAIASNSDIDFESSTEGNGYLLINGKVHAEGFIDLDGNHIYMNTPNFTDNTGLHVNPNYDPLWKTTYTSAISPNGPTYTGPAQKIAAGSITLPEVNYAFYRNQANFTKQQVFVYTGSKRDWTVAEFNNYFKPTGAYTSSIVIMEDGQINLTGSGTITATILTGTDQDQKGDIFITADSPSGVINFLPAIGLAMIAEKYDISGTVNIGSKDVGAIVIATRELEIEGRGDGKASNVTFWGSIVLGETDDNDSEIELDGDSQSPNILQVNFTDTALKNLPAGWEHWGTIIMIKDNWKES